MTDQATNEALSSIVSIDYPDFAQLPDAVREKFDGLKTKVNFFRMVGSSPSLRTV